MANLINDKYFKSKDIKVFPSSFRGSYKAGEGLSAPIVTFDPEARLNTEANFILPRITLNKSSYIVDYNSDQDEISFVLCGYYFKIAQISSYRNEIAGKYIGVTLRSIALQDSEINVQLQLDSPRSTQILDSWETSSDNILDYKDSATNTYVFTGLKVFASDFEANNYSMKIKLFTAEEELNQEACLPKIGQGSGSNTLIHGEGLNAAYSNQTVIGKYNDNKSGSLFEVGGGSAINRKNIVEVNPTEIKLNADDISITGNTSIDENLNVAKKVTTNTYTDSEDSLYTLTTRSYVDGSISRIGTGAISGGTGQYLRAISQSGAMISPVAQPFDTSISVAAATHDNAPTSQAVSDFVRLNISELDVNEVGGDGVFIQKISETDGKINATSKAFVQSFDKEVAPNAYKEETSVPTAKAVYDYVDKVRINLENKITGDISTKVTSLKVDPAGSTGSYIKTINQTEGKLAATPQSFDTSISAETAANDNAPTSAAVKTFVDNNIQNIWLDKLVLPSKADNAPLMTLKDIVLDAMYPKGSIYLQYVADGEAIPTTCPVATTESVWSKISTGTFLCAAGGEVDSANRYSHGKTGGSADAVSIAHDHKNLNTESSIAGVTINELKDRVGWFSVRTMQSNDSKTIPDWDGAIVYSNDYLTDTRSSIDYHGKSTAQRVKIKLDHSHSYTDPGHTHTVKIENSGGEDGTNRNLPPYLTVYMWRRDA